MIFKRKPTVYRPWAAVAVCLLGLWGAPALAGAQDTGVSQSSESVELVQNAGFEQTTDGVLDEWIEDAEDGGLAVDATGLTPYAGVHCLSKSASDTDTGGTMYQIIDLADNIEGWSGAVSVFTGDTVECQFLYINLSAWVANPGGGTARVSLEYLPYSYNEVDGITAEHTAWQTRDWVSDGSEFTNTGGDVIDQGALIEETADGADSDWHQLTYDGWLPRVRWIKLKIELDARDAAGESALVAMDAVDFTAEAREVGPYSNIVGYGADDHPEIPGAPDEPVPYYIGPEGDGIGPSGTAGVTDCNYINPAFAGYPDDEINSSHSGQSGGFFGDMSLEMMADYFGPNPSGDYQPGTVTFVYSNTPIVNGEGHDFVTTENGFAVTGTNGTIFGELQYVEVSSDGQTFIRMPNQSLTPYAVGSYGYFIASGVFGLSGKHCGYYGRYWCTPFDLEWIADYPEVVDGTVDINNIRYVRLVDIPGGGPEDAQGGTTSLFYDDYGNPIFDPWLTWGTGGAEPGEPMVLNTSAADSDGDNIADYWDNCPETYNPKQFDTDEDGYGNACDCDINDTYSGVVYKDDYQTFRAAYGSDYTSENWNPDADFDGDLKVTLRDLRIFRQRYGSKAPFE